MDEDVKLLSSGTVLGGALADVPGCRGAALILSGSGPLDRDGNMRKLRLAVSRALADTLASVGVSSLRFDKRGSGQTGGDFYAASMVDNYEDAQAAFHWLKARVPGVPSFVIGHSEGALHAAHLAADDAEVAGVVLIACPVRRGEDILTWQAQQVLPTLPAYSKALIRLLHLDPLRSQQTAFAKVRSSTAESVRVQGKKLNARWIRQFLDYDPVPVFERISAPVLAVIGDHDMQVPPEDLGKLERLVHGECELRTVKGLSHILRPDPDRLGPRGYRKAVKQPVSPAVLDAIEAWISRRAGIRDES